MSTRLAPLTSRAPAPGATGTRRLSLITPSGSPTLGNLPRAGGAAPRGGTRAQHAVRAEPGARAPTAGLPARVRGLQRRAGADDPVQAAPARRRLEPGGAADLPGADGRRHPALPAGPGAGRRRPAPARRAGARPRRSLQPHLRRGVQGARDRGGTGRGAGDGPAAAHPQDRARRHRQRDRVHRRTRGPCGQARRDQPARRAGGLRRLRRGHQHLRCAQARGHPGPLEAAYDAGQARCRDVTAPVLAAAEAAMGL